MHSHPFSNSKPNGRDFLIPDGTILSPGDYLVICEDSSAYRSLHPGAAPCAGDWGFALSAAGETVRLYDPTGSLVDRVAWDDRTPWPEAADGRTGRTRRHHPI